MERPYPSVVITEKAERAARGGHPWVYGDEITQVRGMPENGGIVDVYTKKDRWLGAGFYNDHSKIRVRILSNNTNDRYDRAYWRRKLQWAVEYRKTVMGPDFACCRLIFGESDGFPGLTVDRFGRVLVAQVLCLGTDRIKVELFTDLVDILRTMGEEIDIVYERSDVAIREKEGLEQYQGYFLGNGNGHTEITENGVRYDVDYINGQKTGFFLDQKYNRAAVARLAPGKKVLDCFTHTGAFGLNCALAGAEHVTSVDISDTALDTARRNAALNGLENIDFLCTDVFQLLTDLSAKGRADYDLIILDPPAFTKSGATVKSAVRGYKDINMRAMKILPRGGYLATCSCSHFMTEPLFVQMLRDAAKDAHVTLRQIEARQQSADHPIDWNIPEPNYLKFYIFQVV